MAASDDLARKPAVLLLDDGTRATLPDLTVGEALDLVRMARENNVLVGGELDPRRIVEVGYESEEPN